MNYYHFVGNNVHKGIGYVKNMIHYWSGNTTDRWNSQYSQLVFQRSFIVLSLTETINSKGIYLDCIPWLLVYYIPIRFTIFRFKHEKYTCIYLFEKIISKFLITSLLFFLLRIIDEDNIIEEFWLWLKNQTSNYLKFTDS